MEQFKNIYFIGIGGIGMSNLAQYFLQKGYNIAGYDRTPSSITSMLQSKGIPITFDQEVTSIPKKFTVKKQTLVIYTPAVKEHPQLEYFTSRKFQILKRSAVLGEITKDSFCFAVAGTHGKTTTTTILAHILVQVGAPVSAFLGGISENFNSNLVLNGDKYTVVEADEFDRSFLTLSPNIACITADDSDHLDIYGSEEEFKKAFFEFTKKIKFGGRLLVRSGLDYPFSIKFGMDKESNYHIRNLTVKDGAYHFDIWHVKGIVRTDIATDCVLHKPGVHNLMNALAAVAMAHTAGFNLQELGNALASFKGVDRRFSYKINTPSQVLIDDYAHHPTELNALNQAVKEMYPNKKSTIIFQPHLFTRTRDFADGFAKSLSNFDRVVLLDIYPARELPIEGITSEWLLSKIDAKEKFLVKKENLAEWVKNNKNELLLMVGAGDIGAMVDEIKKVLSHES